MDIRPEPEVGWGEPTDEDTEKFPQKEEKTVEIKPKLEVQNKVLPDPNALTYEDIQQAVHGKGIPNWVWIAGGILIFVIILMVVLGVRG